MHKLRAPEWTRAALTENPCPDRLTVPRANDRKQLSTATRTRHSIQRDHEIVHWPRNGNPSVSAQSNPQQLTLLKSAKTESEKDVGGQRKLKNIVIIGSLGLRKLTLREQRELTELLDKNYVFLYLCFIL